MDKKNQVKRIYIGVFPILVLMVFATSFSNADNNLIVNGSFEEGTDPGEYFVTLEPGSTDITGWTVTQSNIDYIGNLWMSSDGNRDLDLNGNQGGGGISQSFLTTPGFSYLVVFDLAGNPEGPPIVKNMRVEAADQVADFSFDTSNCTFTDMKWVTCSWVFGAIAEQTLIEFYSYNTTGCCWGPALDNVFVYEDPLGLMIFSSYDDLENTNALYEVTFDLTPGGSPISGELPGQVIGGTYSSYGVVFDTDDAAFNGYDPYLGSNVAAPLTPPNVLTGSPGSGEYSIIMDFNVPVTVVGMQFYGYGDIIVSGFSGTSTTFRFDGRNGIDGTFLGLMANEFLKTIEIADVDGVVNGSGFNAIDNLKFGMQENHDYGKNLADRIRDVIARIIQERADYYDIALGSLEVNNLLVDLQTLEDELRITTDPAAMLKAQEALGIMDSIDQNYPDSQLPYQVADSLTSIYGDIWSIVSPATNLTNVFAGVAFSQLFKFELKFAFTLLNMGLGEIQREIYIGDRYFKENYQTPSGKSIFNSSYNSTKVERIIPYRIYPKDKFFQEFLGGGPEDEKYIYWDVFYSDDLGRCYVLLNMVGGDWSVAKRGRLMGVFGAQYDWADLDGDGLVDMIAGGLNETAHIYFAKNIGTKEMPKFTHPERIIMGTKVLNHLYVHNERTFQYWGLSGPLMEDWDNDGDLDMYVNANSWYADQHFYYENIGGAKHYKFVRTQKAPKERLKKKFTDAEKGIADWDNDGELERVSSYKRFLKYHPSPDSEGVPIAGCNVYINRIRPFDIDNDGDLDIMIGCHDGTLQFSRNMGILKGTPYFARPQNVPAENADLACGTFSRPAAADWDGDGDIDLFSGAEHGRIIYFENIGDKDKPVYIEQGYLMANGQPITFHGDVREPNGEHWGYSSLTVIDWDGDGDPDVMATERMGFTNYYENIGSKTKPQLAYSVRLKREDGSLIQSNPRIRPGFYDWNNDGYLDMISSKKSVGNAKANAEIFYNTGSKERLTFKSGGVLKAPDGKILQEAGVGGRTQFCPIDWNGDGLKDFIDINHVSNAWPKYFENIGTREKPQFVQKADPKFKGHRLWVEIGHAASIWAIDWDNDGRQDVLLGGEDGRIRYLNRKLFDAPPEIKTVIISDKSGARKIDDGMMYIDIDRYVEENSIYFEDLNKAEGAEKWVWNNNTAAHRYDALTLEKAEGTEKIVYDPKLKGTYDIYVGFDVIGSHAKVRIKLSGDADWDPMQTSVMLEEYKLTSDFRQPKNHFEQVYWKEAEMTGQKIEIVPEKGARVYLDYIRFVPQSRVDLISQHGK